MAGGLTATLAELATPERVQKLRRFVVPAAAVLAFFVFLLATFPYDMVARRIEAEAARAGLELTIGSIGGRGLFGVRARDVRARIPGAGETPIELRFDRVDASPDLFALLFRRTSFGFALQGYGSSAKGHAAISDDPKLPGLSSLRLEAQDLDLKSLPLMDLAGLEGSGRASLKLDVSSLQPAEAANGMLSLTGRQLGVTSGNVRGFPLPRTSLGDVDASVSIDKGVAKIDKAQARGGDLESDADGTVRLRPLLSLSQADLHVRFRPADRWLNDNGLIKSALGLIAAARQPDGSYVFTFTGPLSRLNSRPGR
jgi:type II secretion system protein N